MLVCESPLSALTMAEYFRDTTGKDTLLFVDNIFRFSQAGSEVSALLGRMPSAVGYQPTLATEMGALQERIASTSKGAITSVQAVYVPADDPTDPAPATAFGQLDAFIYLERSISEKGIYPAIDPLASVQPNSGSAVRGRTTLRDRSPSANDVAAIRRIAGHHRHSGRRRIERRGQDWSSIVLAASSGSCRNRSSWPRSSRASRGKSPRWKIRFAASRKSATANGIICQNKPSCMSARSSKRKNKPRSWQPRHNRSWPK